MSQVKKLESGGTAEFDLDKALNEELALYNFKSKDERKIRDSLAKLRDHAIANKDSFKIDPVSKRYTVSGPNSEQFQGSPDDIRSSWITGNLKIKDDLDAMSVAAAILGGAMNKSSKPTNTNTKIDKDKFAIGNIRDYIVDKVYGTPEAFEAEFDKMKTDDERKKTVLPLVDKYLAQYISDAEKNSDKLDYKDLEEVKKLKALVLPNDINSWDAVKTGSYPFKWNLNEFLIQDREKENWENANLAEQNKKDETARLVKEKADQDQLNEAKNVFLKLGFNDALATQLATNKWKIGELRPPQGYPEDVKFPLNEYVKTKGGIVLENEFGKQMVFTPSGNFLNESGEKFDLFNRLNGIAWQHNPNDNTLEYVTSKYVKPDYGNVGKTLRGTVPGYDTTWSIEGWSGTDATPEGGRDYTKHLVLRKGNEEKKLTKGNDGVYRYPDGTALEGKPLFIGFGPESSDIMQVDYIKLFPKLYDGTLDLDTDYNYLEDYASLKSRIDSRQVGSGGFLENVAKRLLWFVSHKDIGTNRKKEILDLLTTYQEEVNKLKNGGIIKAQAGSKFFEYAKRINAIPSDSPESTENKPFRDISGTFADQSNFQNAMDIVSTAGIIGSFVPGVGAIGAGVTTTADLAKDLEDGSIDDWGTHLLNLGFVGLSAVGLGGVRALLKAGKAADKSFDILKLTKKATKVNLTEAEKLAIKEVEVLSQKYGSKTTGELLTKIAQAGDKQADISKGLEALKVVDDASTSYLNSLVKGKNLQAGAEKLLGNKYVNNSVRVATMLPGIEAAYETAPVIASGEWDLIKPENLKKLAITGSVGKTWLNDFRGVRAITRQATKTTVNEAKTTFKLGDKTYEVKKLVNLPKTEKTRIPWKQAKVEAKNTKSQEELKDELISTLVKEKQITAEEAKTLKDLELSNVSPYHSVDDGIYKLGDSPKSVTGDRRIDTRDYEIAAKHLKAKTSNTKVRTKNNKPNKPEKPEKPNTPETKVNSTDMIFIGKPKRVWEPKVTPSSTVYHMSPESVKSLPAAKETLMLPAHVTPPKVKKVYPKKVKQKSIKPKKAKETKLRDIVSDERLTNTFTGDFKPKVSPREVKTNELHYRKLQTSKPQGKANTKNKTTSPKAKLPRRKSGGILKLQGGTTGSANILLRKGLLNSLGDFSKGLDTTDIANLGMYASTIAANKYIGDEQRQAAEAGIVKPTLMPHNYIRIDKTNSLEADKQAANVLSQSRRIAEASSDVDKGKAIQLEGMNKANEITTKGQQFDLARLDKLRNLQLDSNLRVNQFNAAAVDKGKAITADAFRKIHLINANQKNAQNTAFGNVARAFEKNYGAKNFKNAMIEYNNLVNDPLLKNKLVEYQKLAGDEGRLQAETEYNKIKESNTAGTLPPFEESSQFKTWQQRVKDLEKELEVPMNLIKEKQSHIQTLQTLLYLKKGGSTLSKADKIEIENLKNDQKMRMKELEMAYKAVFHNNEMLQKALIKVFK